MSTKYEWGFHYAGPREAEADPNCTTCRSKAGKQCVEHKRNFVDGCAHCAAARGGECHAHWGLQAALDYFAKPETGALTEEARADFERARTIALGEETHPKKRNVTVTMRGNGPSVEGPREFFVSVTPY